MGRRGGIIARLEALGEMGIEAPPAKEGGMQRYFHVGYRVQLLLKEWVPHSAGTYVLTLAAVFILAVFHEWFGDLERRSVEALHRSAWAAPPYFSGGGAVEPAPTASAAASGGGEDAAQPPHRARAKAADVGGAVRAVARSLVMRHRSGRAALVTLVYTLRAATSYLLMLVVMSFNAGVFLSVLAGLAAGFVLFRVNHLKPASS